MITITNVEKSLHEIRLNDIVVGSFYHKTNIRLSSTLLAAAKAIEHIELQKEREAASKLSFKV